MANIHLLYCVADQIFNASEIPDLYFKNYVFIVLTKGHIRVFEKKNEPERTEKDLIKSPKRR